MPLTLCVFLEWFPQLLFRPRGTCPRGARGAYRGAARGGGTLNCNCLQTHMFVTKHILFQGIDWMLVLI